MKEEGKRLIDRLEKGHGLPRAERYRLDQRVDLIRGIWKSYPHCAITLSKTSSTKSIPGTPQTVPVESERDRLPDRVRIYGGNRGRRQCGDA